MKGRDPQPGDITKEVARKGKKTIPTHDPCDARLNSLLLSYKALGCLTNSQIIWHFLNIELN